MSNNVVKWLVEEKDQKTNAVVYSQEFSSYDEAFDVYNSLKTEHVDTLVSIEKTERKLLVE